MFRVNYLIIGNATVKTRRRFKQGKEDKPANLYIYHMLVDGRLVRFKIAKITKYKNTIEHCANIIA